MPHANVRDTSCVPVPSSVLCPRQAEDWETREAECAKTINELRDSMDGRSTRVVAVLMQEKPLADGDPMVEERAVSLRNACLLKTRSSLFALPSPVRQLRHYCYLIISRIS